MNRDNCADTKAFVTKNKLSGLSAASIQALIEHRAGYSITRAQDFLRFSRRINLELLQHPVIVNNGYTRWFEQGQFSKSQASDFLVQFSVFSNLFLIAQLKKTINADTLEGMRASKEILANEIGVIFKPAKAQPEALAPLSAEVAEGDTGLVSTQGSVEGGTFRFRAAHFEWLLRMAGKLGLGFNQVGKRSHGSEPTLFFCDELARLYGSEDYMISQAASYAVENWAAAGFWEQLICGFECYNARSNEQLPLVFFTYHAKIEAQHAAHTQEELEELYFSRDIDEDRFIHYANEMLNGVEVFWQGLDAGRRAGGRDQNQTG